MKGSGCMRLLSGFRCRWCGAFLPIEMEKSIKKLVRVRCERCGEWNSIVEQHTTPSAKESMRKR